MARPIVSNINSEPHLCQRASHIESVSWLTVMRRNCRISVFALLLGTSLAQTLGVNPLVETN